MIGIKHVLKDGNVRSEFEREEGKLVAPGAHADLEKEMVSQ
jgi:hypothetical protein